MALADNYPGGLRFFAICGKVEALTLHSGFPAWFAGPFPATGTFVLGSPSKKAIATPVLSSAAIKI
jgi:hypothetical protein